MLSELPPLPTQIPEVQKVNTTQKQWLQEIINLAKEKKQIANSVIPVDPKTGEPFKVAQNEDRIIREFPSSTNIPSTKEEKADVGPILKIVEVNGDKKIQLVNQLPHGARLIDFLGSIVKVDGKNIRILSEDSVKIVRSKLEELIRVIDRNGVSSLEKPLLVYMISGLVKNGNILAVKVEIRNGNWYIPGFSKKMLNEIKKQTIQALDFLNNVYPPEAPRMP